MRWLFTAILVIGLVAYCSATFSFLKGLRLRRFRFRRLFGGRVSSSSSSTRRRSEITDKRDKESSTSTTVATNSYAIDSRYDGYNQYGGYGPATNNKYAGYKSDYGGYPYGSYGNYGGGGNDGYSYGYNHGYGQGGDNNRHETTGDNDNDKKAAAVGSSKVEVGSSDAVKGDNGNRGMVIGDADNHMTLGDATAGKRIGKPAEKMATIISHH